MAAASAVLATVMPTAAQPASSSHREFPAGEACAGFGVDLHEYPTANGVRIDTATPSGERVVVLAGSGVITLVNSVSQKTVSLEGKRSTATKTFNPDGSVAHKVAGRVVVINGQGRGSTTQAEEVLLTVDANGVVVSVGFPRTRTDLCAQLS